MTRPVCVMLDERHVHSSIDLHAHVKRLADMEAARVERQCRTLLEEIVPSRLHWLLDHPRWLRFYLTLTRQRPRLTYRTYGATTARLS